MRLRLAKAMMVFALIALIGGHWVLLQSVAWVGMFAKYSQVLSISEALSMTFDGQHPCKLCLRVQTGKQSQQKQESLNVETKLEYCYVRDFLILVAPPLVKSSTGFDDSWLFRSEAPPTPPPRLA